MTFTDGLIRASQITTTTPPDPLFLGIYPGAVTMLNGEPGAGKSTVAYTVAVHAALGLPLWGFDFGGERINVLYLDPENGPIRGSKLRNIGHGMPDNLFFHNAADLDILDPRRHGEVYETITNESIGLLIVDTVSSAFNTSDENNNAEATREMKALERLIINDCAVLGIHHIGKKGENVSQPHWGRGASARYGKARAVLALTTRGSRQEDEEGDESAMRQPIRQLRLHKDNIGGQSGRALFLKSAGQDRLELTTSADWKNGAPSESQSQKLKRHEAKRADAQGIILKELATGEEIPRTQLISILGANGVGTLAAQKSLDALVSDAIIAKQKSGRGDFYRIVKSELEREVAK